MTDEEMRIKIAEANGIEFAKWGKDWMLLSAPNLAEPVRIKLNGRTLEEGKLDYISALPDYLNSLDAMHEAEKVLTWRQHLAFRKNLWDLVITLGPEDTWDRQFISATARQRAEAFIKTLNL